MCSRRPKTTTFLPRALENSLLSCKKSPKKQRIQADGRLICSLTTQKNQKVLLIQRLASNAMKAKKTPTTFSVSIENNHILHGWRKLLLGPGNRVSNLGGYPNDLESELQNTRGSLWCNFYLLPRTRDDLWGASARAISRRYARTGTTYPGHGYDTARR